MLVMQVLILKSDHFGIETFILVLLCNNLMVLKSDHFGIETIIIHLHSVQTHTLKSDHFGIETTSGYELLPYSNHTKIRPFWD